MKRETEYASPEVEVIQLGSNDSVIVCSTQLNGTTTESIYEELFEW